MGGISIKDNSYTIVYITYVKLMFRHLNDFFSISEYVIILW